MSRVACHQSSFSSKVIPSRRSRIAKGGDKSVPISLKGHGLPIRRVSSSVQQMPSWREWPLSDNTVSPKAQVCTRLTIFSLKMTQRTCHTTNLVLYCPQSLFLAPPGLTHSGALTWSRVINSVRIAWTTVRHE